MYRLLPAISCKQSENAKDVANVLKKSVMRHVFVVDKNQLPIGIISTTDINNRVVANGFNPNDIKAEAIMTHPIEYYDIEDDSKKIYKEMVENKRMSVAIVSKNKFAGVLTLSALLEYMTGG